MTRSLLVSAILLLAACGGGGSSSPTGPGNVSTDTSVAAQCRDGGAGVVRDGWTRTIGPEFVTAKKDDVALAIVYSFAIDDSIRNAANFAEGVWDKLLGGEYTAGQRTSGGDGAGLLPYAMGPAVEIATGNPVYVMVVAPRSNGIVYPTIAIAPDQQALEAKVASPDALANLRGLNFFPLDCTGVAGKWTSSSVDAVQTYDANGYFTGITVTSLRIDVAFDPSGQYSFKAKVSSNTGVQREDESGSYTIGDQLITLNGSSGKTTNFDAGFVAVRGGIALQITDQQFVGDQWLLFRAP
jgi:hypothetical protein